MKYKIEDKPPYFIRLTLGSQHILTMLGATVAVPTIISSFFGLDQQQTALLISNVLLAMGFATIFQSLIGAKLPIIQGSSFAFLPAILYTSTIYPGSEGLQYMIGGILIGGLVQALIGLSGIAGWLQKHLTPVVIGPTIMAIGLSLFSVAGEKIALNWFVGLLTIFMVFMFGFGLKFYKPKINKVLETYPIVITVLLIWFVCFILSYVGLIPKDSGLYIDLTFITNISYIKQEYIFSWGYPKIDMGILFVFIISYLVSTVESIGDYNAVYEISTNKKEKLGSNIINRGITTEGFSCSLAAILGGVPTTSYSENIGVVGITGVASRYVIATSGILLVIFGIFPVFGGMLSTIPSPVMGGLYAVLFGMIIGIGMKYAAISNLDSLRNVSIIGFSLLFGLSISHVLSLPQAEKEIVEILPKLLSDILLGIGKSGMATTMMAALFLDKILVEDELSKK